MGGHGDPQRHIAATMWGQAPGDDCSVGRTAEHGPNQFDSGMHPYRATEIGEGNSGL